MFIKEKSVFMIIILIVSIFYISLFNAKDVNAQETYCLEKTNDGRWCVESESLSNLAPSYRYNPNTCDQTSFCKTGCCIDDETGVCAYRSLEKKCDEDEGRFTAEDSLCFQDNVCTKGCCVIGTSFTLKTEKECVLEANNRGYESKWYGGESEQQCSEKSRASEKGCCVTGDGLRREDYKYITRENCNGPDKEFSYNKYCSQVNPSICRSQNQKKCGDGNDENIVNAYWYDNCGQPEGVALDCDYPERTICGYNENNEISCIPVDCSKNIIPDFKTLDDGASLVPWNKKDKLNGESWCVYEGKTGDANDLVGSRHYVASCINGKFRLEECEEKRKEICIQNSLTQPTTASCRLNLAPYCMGCDNEENENVKDKKTCCEKLGDDCFWFEQSDVGLGICAPNVPVGTLGEEDLDGFKIDCTWRDKRKLGDDRWRCDKNCFCKDFGFAEDIEKLCRSLGDFGYKYNLVGEKPEDFFIVLGAQGGYVGGYIANNLWENFNFYKKSTQGIFSEFIPSYDSSLTAEEVEVLGFELGSDNFWRVLRIHTSQYILGGAATGAGVGFFIGGPPGAAIGAAIGAIAAFREFLTGTRYRNRTITYECKPWQAPYGGENCEKCDTNDGRICDEYKCDSLGQSCDFDDGECFALNQNDATPPVIKKPDEYQYDVEDVINNNRVIGYKITQPQSFPYYGSISLKIKTEDDSGSRTLCKVTKEVQEEPFGNLRTDEESKARFDDLPGFGNLRSHVHEIRVTHADYQRTLDDEENEVEIILNEKTYFKPGENNYYVYCADHNSNVNQAPFVIRFNVIENPILRAAVLSEFGLEDGTFIKYGAGSIDLSFESDIPIDQETGCRYSDESGIVFDVMEGNGGCSPTINSEGRYSCMAFDLPIQDEQDNKFYFRCNASYLNYLENDETRTDKYIVNENDQPIGGLNLKGTSELEISDINIEDEEIVETKNFELKIQTSGGANNKASCQYNYINLDNPRPMILIPFYTTRDTSTHTTSVRLNDGDYEFYFECKDIAGNKATDEVTFTVETPDLIIEEISPADGETIYEDTFDVEIKTSGGVELNGNSECEYKIGNGNYINVLDKETLGDNTIHTKEDINVEDLATVILGVKCTDSEGKSDEKTITIYISTEAQPKLVQVYTVSRELNVVMDEPVLECKYDSESFEDEEDYENSENMMIKVNDYHYKLSIGNQDVYYIVCKHKHTETLSPEYKIQI
jgi:hypothetical protein